MTDKTKPWASSDHPEVIACKNVGEKLFTELELQGVDLRGFGIGVSDDNQNVVIRVYAFSEEDAAKVPSTYDGYEVKAVVTGDIVAL